jgi:hypothetical protein
MVPQTELERQVELRAGSRCEYCRMHQSLQGATFHLEYVLPKSRGGMTDFSNLAWACPGCNLRKSDRIVLPNPIGGESVEIFNPRIHIWSHRFIWEDYEMVGSSPIGRALILAFELNHPRRALIRQAEQMFGLFPPESG